MVNNKFKVTPHETMPGNQMVEFWRDGAFVAGIYPHEDGIRIVSKFMDGVNQEPGYPPSVVVYLSGIEKLEVGDGTGKSPKDS